MVISASIVAYKTPKEELLKVSQCFLNNKINGKLYIIDNSPADTLRGFCDTDKVEYIHNSSNPGFGAAHNIAIKLAVEAGSNYHFVVNPDIYFDGDVIASMVNYMVSNPNIGMIMPEVLYPDGSIQNLPKLLPNPLDIIFRKLKRPAVFYKKFIDKYELRFVDKKMVYRAPILSGCFTLLNLNAIKEVGAYDDRFFMYFEDWDLSRRMTEKYLTIYFPKVSIFHSYDSGANKNFHLFKIYLKSAFRYFNKWGWFFDKKRNEMNKKTLAQFK